MQIAQDTLTILKRVECGGERQTEEELRYQLRRDGHPLADSRDLYMRLVEMERGGLLSTELVLTITDEGREALQADRVLEGAA